ncbi:PH domain-containing protein [Streptomyces sp. NPDC053431]|uniref:PH domain-containing protein n=1 Tax=Streptomyces sp. NPDC053431 TaxID=3365703 RepID=UPI0037D59798
MAQARSHRPPESHRAVGRSWIGPVSVCTLLLSIAVAMAWWIVPAVSAEERAWKAAVPCTAPVRPTKDSACLAAWQAVIARTVAGRPKQPSWMYFTDGRPLERADVSMDAAETFRSGDKVELIFWRGKVMTVSGAGHVWHRHVPTPGSAAVPAAAFALLAGYSGALALLRLRCRRLPEDEILPSAAPFAAALVGTALWLLPLCYLHPTDLFTSPTAITGATVGSLITAGLFAWAWRATRVRTPEDYREAGEAEGAGETAEVFLAARFLDDTDYNPNGFGTHIVLGDGPPAVTPHPGPGRFAARPVPVARLTVRTVRRARVGDGEGVPRDWHVAELDDAGIPVRLAAAPANLTRILRALDRAKV